MEKKLTDEEVIEVLKNCGAGIHSSNRECRNCVLEDDGRCVNNLRKYSLDLIHRLQDEVERLKPKKRILANRVYSNETLKRWKKEDLIEHIRILEHNWSCAEESYNNAVKNSDKIFAEQKAEIERLKTFIDFKTANVMCDKCKQQAVKDTAKEICDLILEHWEKKQFVECDWLRVAISEKYGVEVE